MRILILGNETTDEETGEANRAALICIEAQSICYHGGPNKSLRIFESVDEYYAVYGVSFEQADFISRIAFETGQVDFTNLTINGEKTNFIANEWFSLDDDEDEDTDLGGDDDEEDEDEYDPSSPIPVGMDAEGRELYATFPKDDKGLGTLNGIDSDADGERKGIFGLFKK